jgi:hypothetical protein
MKAPLRNSRRFWKEKKISLPLFKLDKSFERSQLTDRSHEDLRRKCPGYRFESKEGNTSRFEFIFVMSGYEEDKE